MTDQKNPLLDLPLARADVELLMGQPEETVLKDGTVIGTGLAVYAVKVNGEFLPGVQVAALDLMGSDIGLASLTMTFHPTKVEFVYPTQEQADEFQAQRHQVLEDHFQKFHRGGAVSTPHTVGEGGQYL